MEIKKLTKKEYNLLLDLAINEIIEWQNFIIKLDKKYYGTKTKKSK